MAERKKIHVAVLFLLTVGTKVTLPVSTENTTSTEVSSTPFNFAGQTMLSNGVSFPGPDGEVASVSCQEIFPELENSTAAHFQGVVECMNATATKNSTSSNATTPGSPGSGGFGMFDLINSGTVSLQTYDAVARAVNYCNLVLIIVGTVLNGFCVAVYVQPSLRSASSTYLAVLCTVELLYLLLTSFLVLLNVLLGSGSSSNYVSLVIGLYVGIYAATACRRLTFALTFIVCFERLMAVAFPLKYKQLRLSGQPARVSVICGVLVALAHLHLALRLDIIPIGGGKYSYKQKPFFVENETALTMYANICRIIFVHLPLVGIVLVNILTTLVLKRHRKTSKMLTTNRDTAKDDKTEKQTTVAILVSSFIFVLFSLPINIDAIVAENLPHYGRLEKEHYLYLTIGRLTTPLELLRSFMDYLSYMILSQRFRSVFMKMFCQRCRRNDAKAKRTEIPKQLTQTTELSSSASNSKP